MTNASTTAICLMEAMRLRKVVVVLLPSADTNSGAFAFTWSGEREPDTVETMFYTQGMPSRWTFTPPDGSLAGMWFTRQTSETQNSVFTLDPDNSTVKVVLDLHIEYVLGDGSTRTITLSAPATYTGVAMRVMPGSASDELFPVGVNYVTS